MGVYRAEGVPLEDPASFRHWGWTKCRHLQRGWGWGYGGSTRSGQKRFWQAYSSWAPTCSSSSTAPSCCRWGGREEEGAEKNEATSFGPSLGWRLARRGPSQGDCWSPYEVPAVPRGETSCPVCKRVFKTHHRAQVHMGVHRGEKFPCGKCGKVLASRRYWTEHTQSCVHGKRATCPVCRKLFASAQTMHKHHQAQHGADSVVPEGGFICPFCSKSFRVRKTWSEHKPYCSANPDKKGPYFCRVVGCSMSDHPFPCMRNLNVHMSNAHGWKEWRVWGIGGWVDDPQPCEWWPP